MKKWIAGILALCLVIGAGGFWMLNREQQPRLDVISRKDALEDYDYLWDTLEENYPFLGVAERKYGLNVQQLKQDYRQQLEGMGKEIDFLEFYHLMGDCLGQFKQLGHLYLYSPNLYQSEVDDIELYLENIRGADKESDTSEFINTMLGYRYENFYHVPEVQQRYQFLGEAEGNQDSQTQQSQQPNLILERLSDKIAYIKIKSFSGEYLGEQPKKDIANFLKENADAPYLVIDVCGNGGGFSNYWSDYIVAPNLTEEKSAPYFCITPYGEAARENLKIDGYDLSNLNDHLEDIAKLPKCNQDDLQTVRYYGGSENTIQPKPEGTVYEGQIFLLVDGGSGSSSDAFAYFCKGSGFATVLGQENAIGSGPGSNHVIDKLPHSNLLFRYRPVQTLDMEGASLEEFGVAPDVLLPTRAKNSNDKVSPLAACRAYIEGLEK